MTLELEKLTAEVEKMAQGAYQRRQEDDRFVDWLLERLHRHAQALDLVNEAMARAIEQVDMKWYRAARPLDDGEPLDAVVDAPVPPPEATVLASDGSQILPNRHAAYLYSVINIGLIAYFHGRGQSPFQDTVPQLDYPNGDADEDTFVDKGAIVNLRRDLAEIRTLVNMAWEYRRADHPVLALIDQRMLYWPVGSFGDDGQRVLLGWQDAMTKARESRCLLAGYIVRPGKRSVLNMLRTLDILKPEFDPKSLTNQDMGPWVNDALLFRRLLGPGQRSKVFVDVSEHNFQFRDRDAGNEVCFFYLNPGRRGRRIARIDIPLSVAEKPEQIAAVHSLIYNQCQIMGDYPYVLTRADELAVVGFRDKEGLEVMIENAMERFGVAGTMTAKQSGKSVARAGRTRHEGLRRQ